MQPVSVAEVADELYSLAPAEFTAARDERARQARAAGYRDDAAAIKKLPRPTASAWLVNQLARTAPEPMTRLYALGEELQDAQRTLAGDRLRELSAQRRQLINDLLPAAGELAGRAGQPASAPVLGEVRATLEAALADAGARAAVRSGRLTKALTYVGLGEVDLAAALAAAEPRAGAPSASRAAGGSRARTRAATAGQDIGGAARGTDDGTDDGTDRLRAAQQDADEAAAAFEAAERTAAGVAQQRQFLRKRIGHLERELAEARASETELSREAMLAERSRDSAARRLASAQRRLTQAQPARAQPARAQSARGGSAQARERRTPPSP